MPSNRNHLSPKLSEINSYIEMINELVSLGTPIRAIIADMVISCEYYAKKKQSESKNLAKSSSNFSMQSAAAAYQTASSETTSKLTNNIQTVSNNNSLSPFERQHPQPNEENVYFFDDEFFNNDEGGLSDDDEVVQSEKNNSSSYLHSVYEKAMTMHQPIRVPRSFSHIANQILELTTNTLVDELLFWCIRFEFPEPLVKLLVSLLPDQRYKDHFVRSFVAQYSYISVMMLQSRSEHICSRVVHISVQLFSNEVTAMKALNECYLLPMLLSTLHNMLFSQNDSMSESLLIK